MSTGRCVLVVGGMSVSTGGCVLVVGGMGVSTGGCVLEGRKYELNPVY